MQFAIQWLVDKFSFLSPISILLLISLMFIVGTVVLLLAMLYEGLGTYALRKIGGDIQVRIGPNRVGPVGLLQFLADGVKLFLKEDIVPTVVDKKLFILAPFITFAASCAAFVALSYSDRLVISNLNIGLFYLLAISSLVVIGVIMAGWASNSKWSLLGGMRAAAQIVSYEIPIGLSLLSVILITQSLNMGEIIRSQSGGWGILNWHIFHNPFVFISFFIYFTAALAEVNQTPFDLPETESELVAGYFTEYSGMRFGFFFMAEWGEIFIVSAIAVTLFLGGWQLPIINNLDIHIYLKNLLQLGVFLGKTFLLIYLMLWIRWTLPRLRVDQIMYMCWKVLLPFAFFNIIGTGLWLLIFKGKGIPELVIQLFS
ncbi:MAG: NADH-quinone oxidoreductase subunit NuoH [Deltaproteobacteria bacterium]|nr:MAG: NADH-quinone oxidoreductase subunit NuoH [Deltaproteobacteria bacterium]